MTIYQLLRLLVKAVTETGQLDMKTAMECADLINRLETSNAFGTVSAITEGIDPRE